ncbi:MAG: pyridoxal phosphate-dependent aminotransferase family protein [Eubacteriales bacterium]
MDLFKKCADYTTPQEVKAQGIYPYFHPLESMQDTEVIIEGRKTIMIGSNNYLGLTCDPRMIEAAKDAADKYGTGCTGSRFLNGTLDLHVALEGKLASFIGKEAALTFGTGFQTNLGIISSLTGRNDYIINDRENHASIIDACRLSFAKKLNYKHNDMADLESVLERIPEDAGKLIITDGVFSMGGDIADLPGIVKLAKKYGARVMVDDAHGLGMLGKSGKGTADYFGLTDDVDIIMGTFSKSLAALGGHMVADETVIEYVKHVSRPFIFSASVTPVSAAVAIKALEILESEPERVTHLAENADYMRAGFERLNIPFGQSKTAIIPVMTYDDEKTFILTKMLLENGVYVNPVISPAVEKGQALLRTSYTATHTTEQLDQVLGVFAELWPKFYN